MRIELNIVTSMRSIIEHCNLYTIPLHHLLSFYLKSYTNIITSFTLPDSKQIY